MTTRALAHSNNRARYHSLGNDWSLYKRAVYTHRYVAVAGLNGMLDINFYDVIFSSLLRHIRCVRRPPRPRRILPPKPSDFFGVIDGVIAAPSAQGRGDVWLGGRCAPARDRVAKGIITTCSGTRVKDRLRIVSNDR